MNEYWNQLQPRERGILILGGVILLAAVAFLLVIEPVLEGREQARERLAETRSQLAWMQAHADTVAERARQASHRSGTDPADRSSDSLLAHVDASARAAGLGDPLQRVRPAGDSVSAGLQDAPFDALMEWLGQLETEDGIVPARLSLERGDRGGHVNAELELGPAGDDHD